MEKLRECPLCYGPSVQERTQARRVRTGCPKCRLWIINKVVHQPIEFAEECGVRSWNTRAVPTTPVGEIAWEKTTFGKLKAGDVFTHHDEAERARDVFNYGEISVCVFANVRPGHSMGLNRPVYRLTFRSNHKDALEKMAHLVIKMWQEAPDRESLNHPLQVNFDDMDNLYAIAKEALEVKP